MNRSRRQFLSDLPPWLLASQAILGWSPRTHAAATLSSPILVNLMLEGGPDLRHLIAPPYDSNTSSVGYNYWSHRYTSHSIGSDTGSWAARWSNDYHSLSSGGVSFGISKTAGWLKEQWDLGHVAIVSNVIGSDNRDHHHSTIIYETGDRSATQSDISRDGWGGRLAQQLSANVVSMTQNVRQFCFAPDASNAQSHTIDRIIAARNSRQMGLFISAEKTKSNKSTDPKAILDRSLTSYYAGKVIATTAKHKIFQTHEDSLRTFGAQIRSRLDQYPLPTTISNLYTKKTSGALNNLGFGEQIRNLYDCLLCNDLLSMKIASLSFGGWDTHKDQRTNIENNFSDIWGTGGGLDTLYTALTPVLPTAIDNMVFVIGGEFGRQLASNGGGGTDHGRGMTMLVIGNRVRGGLYGNPFPSSEVANSPNGYLRENSDILGKTSLDYVLAKVCDRIQTSSGATIFPNLGTASVESSGLLDTLFVS